MDKRVRSPNYPALSLPDAIERCRTIYNKQHTHAAPREQVVQSMGFAGINGASATAYSALLKYGLLRREGDESRLSERAMCILHPNSVEEKAEALQAAAMEPALFGELADKFPGPLPADDILRNYLIRKNFTPAAATIVILTYRETMDLVEREGGAYDSGKFPQTAEAPMTPAARPHGLLSTPPDDQNTVTFRKDERSLGRHDFEDGSYVRIGVHGDLNTEDALAWAEILIANKRKELEMMNRRLPAVIQTGAIKTTNGEHNA